MLCVPELLRSPPPQPLNTLRTIVSGMEVYLQKRMFSLSEVFPFLLGSPSHIHISPHFISLSVPAGICGAHTAVLSVLLFDGPAVI